MLFNHFSSYPTFQVFLGFIVAAALTMVIMPAWIKLLKRTHVGQQVRADGPESHLVKQGTPTMGGAVILLGTMLTCALQASWTIDLVMAVLATLAAAAALASAESAGAKSSHISSLRSPSQLSMRA